MEFGLQVFKRDSVEEEKMGKTFRFAVVDFSKSKSYPSNFVCMLPMKIKKGKISNIFEQNFGDNSLDLANRLLKKALTTENDSEVKTEITRRLKLLDPNQVNQIKCSGCGKQFQPRRIRKFKQNYCSECVNKRYGLRQ
jgi:hypothetical protein